VHAETIDTGATIAVLRAFGPPDVIKVDPFAGNAAALIGADNKWTKIKAVSFELDCAAGGAARTPRLSWLADEAVPFAQALAPFTVAATIHSQITFAADVQQAGAANGPTIIAPMPELTLLPGWELKLDVVAGAAGDTVKNVRVYLQRYVLVDVKHLIGG
jgi:hypothetical protein